MRPGNGCPKTNTVPIACVQYFGKQCDRRLAAASKGSRQRNHVIATLPRAGIDRVDRFRLDLSGNRLQSPSPDRRGAGAQVAIYFAGTMSRLSIITRGALGWPS